MGLFSKFRKKKAEPDKSKKVSKKESKPKKKGLFGRGRKELTLLEQMQLEESVASATLDVVQELADDGGSSIREVDDGFLIVAFTNEMLEEVGLDSSSEEFGSFVEGLRSEIIESIALANDLDEGIIGIIPSIETLLALDEYDFVHEMEFQWAIVPYGLEDEDQLILLDDTVGIDKLLVIANQPNAGLEIVDGKVVDSQGGVEEDSFDTGFEDDFEDGLEDDLEDDFEDGLDDDFEFDDFDVPEEIVNEESDLDEFDVGFEEFENEMLEDYEDELDLDDDFTDLDDDFEFEDEVEETEVTAEEIQETVEKITVQNFNNRELDLSIDMTIFDNYFDSISIAKFDKLEHDGSELQKVISKLRQDANVELERFHQENIQSLRNKYTTSMRDIHDKLVDSLDHTNEDTTYGVRFYEIDKEYEDNIDDLDRLVSEQTEGIRKRYAEERTAFAENARREAEALYDSRHKAQRDKEILAVRDDTKSNLKTERDVKVGELYKDRKNVARRLFDKATTALLQNLQEEYQKISQRELEMYDTFRKDMDAYLRRHFSDEVLRAKAEAEKMRQSHEAERVRKEYEQMLLTKTKQLEEADNRAREALRQLDDNHKEQLDLVKADYERRIKREQSDNKDLRDLLQESNRSNSRIGEQKEKEIEHRLKLYEDTIKAKDLELKYANERADRSHRPMKFIIVAASMITLAVGVILGFLFGVGMM